MLKRARSSFRQMPGIRFMIGLLTLFLSLEIVNGDGGGSSISSIPKVVGSQSATLVVQFFTETNIKQGGKIQIIVPKQASVVDGNHECYLQSFIQRDGLLCIADSKNNTLTLELDFELPAFAPSELRFKYAFNVPLSTAPTDSFIVNFMTRNEEIFETHKDGIFIDGLEIASIQAATITQVDNSRVGKLTQAYFSVTTLNPIPPGGGLQIKFPKWNSMAPAALRDSFVVLPEDYDAALQSGQNKRLLQSEKKLCQPKLGVSSTSRCVLHTTSNYDYLTLIDAFPNGQPAGQTFSFYVSYIRNPISLSAVPFLLQTYSGIQEQTDDEILFKGLIDEGKAVMVAEDGAIMDPQFSKISADVTVVQEYSVFYVPFSAPVPIQRGCIVLIQLPEDFTLVEGNIQNVQGWGIFGGKSTLTAELDTAARTIKIVNQCVNYSSANLESTVQIQSLRNPNYVLETKTFAISILDSNSNLIASINQAITYKPTNGTVNDISLVSVSGVEIQTISDIILTFTPTHALTGDSYFMLKLPNNIEFTCNLAYTQNLKTAPTCIKLSSNELQFNSTFIDESYQGNQPLTIAFKNRVLPGSKQPVQGISIKTYQINNGKAYLVDSYVNPEMVFFETQTTLFFSASVKSSSEITYSNTGLTFDVTLANDVPIGSIIRIEFPKEIRLANIFVVQRFCKAMSGLQSIIACQFVLKKVSYIDDLGNQNSAEVVVLTARNGFAAVGMKQQDDFAIAISTGVITPISVKTSGTFIIQVLDSQEREINYVRSAMTLTMKQGIDVGPLDLVSDSYQVGAFTNHTLTFTTPVPLIDGTRIYILIPEEVGTLTAGKFTVSSALPIGQNFTSSIIGNKITIIVAVDPSVEGGEIKDNSKISFTFGPLKNPQSMAPSGPYKVRIESNDGYEEADQVTTGVKMRNQVGAKIKDYSFTAFDQRQGALTTITITWQNTQVYPQDLSLIIKFDPSQIYPKLPEGSRTAQCLFRDSRFVECQFFDDYIKVNKIIASPEMAGQTLSLTITNMYFDVFKALETNSWSMKTFTQDGVFEIDEIDSPMTFKFDCNYPCLSCNAPSECTKCNDFDIGGYLILYNRKCYADCPDGTYEESFQCKPCNPKCKTCSKNNPQFCTSCNSESEFPFLDGNTCTQQCSFGKYGNYGSAKCELCAKPCQSCTDDATTCLTCDQTAIEKYFHQNQCLRQCPFNFVAEFTTRSTICEPCSPNCFGCQGTKDVCLNCPPGKLLNLYQNANNCTTTCPADVSVENRKGAQPICEPCDDKCLTCKGTAKFCTSCRQNFNLKEELGICALECDTLSFKQVPFDGQCVACDPICKTCQGTKDNCLSCWPGTFWYDKTCVPQCPVVEGYQYEPDDNNRCIIPGLRCKFGYKVSETGNFCQLVLSVCPPPTLINFDKDKCIPGSDRWVPFPIWILWIAPTLIILLISKIKAMETNLVQNWIVLLGIAEIAAMFYIIFLAREFGITPITALIGFTIAIHYGINFFFLLVFTKQVKNDTALTHWCQYNRKITTTITVIGTLFNFKAYRLFFSRLFGRDEFNAPMESPIIFYAPFNLSGLLNLVLVKLVVLFACVFCIYYVRWGYQLLIECLELLFIEILIIILYVIEYFQMRQTLLKQKQYQQIDPRKVDAGKVMGGIEFSSEEDSQEIVDPKVKERRGKPKAIKTIHQMEKILLEFDHKEMRRNYGRHEYVSDDDLKEREIMRRHRRHCMSYRGLPLTMPDAWLSDDSDEVQNYISEPNSPRSKQMLHNSQFITRMHILREALRDRYQGNNCYAQAVDFSKKPMRNIKLVSAKVQTNVMELLGLDDLLLAPQQEPLSEVSDQSSRYIEEVFEETATAKMINNVIMRIDSDHDVDDKDQRELVNKKLTTAPTKKKRKQRKLTKKRIAEIPNYDPEEIVGEFTRDEKGFNLMVRSRNGKLNDKFGRMINRRGYLVDKNNNVVTRGGVFIFHADELNDDDEIPAPYCFSRPSQLLFKVVDYADYKKQQKQHRLAMQDQFIEREYQRLKAESTQKSNSVTVKPASQVNRSTKFDRQSEGTKSGKSALRASIQDEESLSQIIEPIKPKTKAQLLAKSSSSSLAAKARIKSEYERKSSGSRVLSGATKRGRSRGSQDSIERDQRKSSKHSGKHGKSSTVDDPYLTGAEISNQLIQMQSEYEFQHEMRQNAKDMDTVTGFQNDQDLVGLKFDDVNHNQPQKSSKSQKDKRKQSARSTKDYQPDVYVQNQRKMQANQQAIKQDEHFISKMTKFNNYVNEKKLKYLQQLNYASSSSIQMDDRSYINADGSVKSMGLRHQSLGQIYGRVRQRFNKQIRQGGAALKFGMADSRNLMPHGTDDIIPENILQLDLGESYMIQRKSSFGSKRHNKIMDSAKLQELQQIYSNVRPDLNSAQRDQSIMNYSLGQRSDIVGGELTMTKFGPKSTAVIQPALFHDLPKRVSDQSATLAKATVDDINRQMQQMRRLISDQPGSSFDNSANSKPRHHEAQSANQNAGAYDLLHGKYI